LFPLVFRLQQFFLLPSVFRSDFFTGSCATPCRL
jgi:hypothetical protein